jgi:SAM-dependent methyltransferase
LSSAGTGTFEGHDYAYLRCTDCKTVLVWPPPPPPLIERMYGPEYVDAHYAAGALESEELHATVDRLAGLKPGGTLLDVGAGAGGLMQAASARGLRVDGFELNPATANALAAKTGRPVHSGRLSDVPGRYELVHLADVLEHSPAPVELLREAVRRVAPGGVLCARGPLEAQRNVFDSAMRVRRALRSRWAPARAELPPWHLCLFSLSGWHQLLERAGLSIVEEQVTEVWWPIQPTDSSFRGLTKRASMTLSASWLGRRIRLGNRVVSVVRPR